MATTDNKDDDKVVVFSKHDDSGLYVIGDIHNIVAFTRAQIDDLYLKLRIFYGDVNDG